MLQEQLSPGFGLTGLMDTFIPMVEKMSVYNLNQKEQASCMFSILLLSM